MHDGRARLDRRLRIPTVIATHRRKLSSDQVQRRSSIQLMRHSKDIDAVEPVRSLKSGRIYIICSNLAAVVVLPHIRVLETRYRLPTQAIRPLEQRIRRAPGHNELTWSDQPTDVWPVQHQDVSRAVISL